MLNRPYKTLTLNVSECVNEVIITIVCYHLILLSDFVPQANQEMKIASGFSMISIISLTVLGFLMMIVYPIATGVFAGMSIAYRKYKFNKQKKKSIENKALEIQAKTDFIKFLEEQENIKQMELYKLTGEKR